jgi:GNAT superfamily N-acetyltransferase
VRDLTVRSFRVTDVAWAEQVIGGSFAGRMQARLGELVDALSFPGIVAERDGVPCGLLTFDDRGPDVEVVYLEALDKGAGVGTALLEALVERNASRRLWLITTNDKVDALRFYQRRGFRIVDVRPGAVDAARSSLKPDIPEIGNYGIPLRDEIVLERTPT